MDHHEPRRIASMSTALADLETAGAAARRLVEIEAARSGVPVDRAKRRVAVREGIAPSTVDNILRRRVKAVAGWVRDRLRAALIRELQSEIMRLEHELAVARLGALHPADPEIAEAEAALAKAKALLGGGR